MAKMAKTGQKLIMNIFWTPKPPFCIKDKKPIYTKFRSYMGLHSSQLPGLLKKFNGSDKTKHVKKCG